MPVLQLRARIGRPEIVWWTRAVGTVVSGERVCRGQKKGGGGRRPVLPRLCWTGGAAAVISRDATGARASSGQRVTSGQSGLEQSGDFTRGCHRSNIGGVNGLPGLFAVYFGSVRVGYFVIRGSRLPASSEPFRTRRASCGRSSGDPDAAVRGMRPVSSWPP